MKFNCRKLLCYQLVAKFCRVVETNIFISAFILEYASYKGKMLLIALNELWINVISILSNIDISPLDSKCIIKWKIIKVVKN